MRHQRYNYDTGNIEPIDLTGSQFNFRIYKPPSYTIDVTVKHEKTCEEITREIKLTEEESAEFHGLETDQERAAFSEKLAAARNLQAMCVEMIRESRSRTWVGRVGLRLAEVRHEWRKLIARAKGLRRSAPPAGP